MIVSIKYWEFYSILPLKKPTSVSFRNLNAWLCPGLPDTPQMRQHPVISEFDHEPYGFLHDFWILFYDKYISRKQMPGPSSQSQVIVQPSHTSLDSQDPNVGAVMNTTPQIIMQEKYSFQHHSSKFLFSTSLA
jgi:hypothetical protein